MNKKSFASYFEEYYGKRNIDISEFVSYAIKNYHTALDAFAKVIEYTDIHTKDDFTDKEISFLSGIPHTGFLKKPNIVYRSMMIDKVDVDDYEIGVPFTYEPLDCNFSSWSMIESKARSFIRDFGSIDPKEDRIVLMKTIVDSKVKYANVKLINTYLRELDIVFATKSNPLRRKYTEMFGEYDMDALEDIYSHSEFSSGMDEEEIIIFGKIPGVVVDSIYW